MLLRVLVITIAMILSACSLEETATGGSDVFDPKNPGSGSSGTILSVTGIQVDTSTPNKVILTWKNPILYAFTNYKIHLYKRQCYYASETCVLDTPTSNFGPAALSEIYQGQGELHEDTKNVVPSENYTYWFYTEKDGVYGGMVKVGVTTTEGGSSVVIAPPERFWVRVAYTTEGARATPGNPSPPFTIYSLSPGATSPAAPLATTGKCASGKSGSLLYCADTQNHRVIIYAKQGALGCDSIADKSSLEYQLCVWSSAGEPYSPVNIIGQPNQYSRLTCQEHAAQETIHYGTTKFATPTDFSKCLTSPTDVFVDGENLLIVDSGNNRVVAHKGLPDSKACDREMLFGSTSVDNCAADVVIGQKGLGSIETFDVSTDGEASLNQPTAVTVVDGDAYVCDGGNDRIVRVKEYSNLASWNCNESTWTASSLCKFSSVLGQKTLKDRETFETAGVIFGAEYAQDTIISPNNFLARHFRRPTDIHYDDATESLLVSTYEDISMHNSYTNTPMQLKARILSFKLTMMSGNSPSCNAATYATGGCDANTVIGQEDVNKIPTWGLSSGTYESNVGYGLDYISSITTANGNLYAVQPKSGSYGNNVKYWQEWTKIPYFGIPYTFSITNPNGAQNPDNPEKSLPALGSISAIHYEPNSSRFYVTDSEDNKIYEVKAYEDQ
nr:hypothetical protein BdHM001_35360 [Bdellovibrio sp. HM001]